MEYSQRADRNAQVREGLGLLALGRTRRASHDIPGNTNSVAIGYTRRDEIRESEKSVDVSGVAVYVAAVLGGAWVCFAAAL